MNYLAHVFLSPPNTLVMTGNLMGDFVKGNSFSNLPVEVVQGIHLHRAIDKFTDQHSCVIELKHLLSQKRKRFTGIISDIVFDHFLASKWQMYTNENITNFAERHYHALNENLTVMPNSMQTMVLKMIERNWLARYDCIVTTGLAIDAVSERIRFKNNLAGAIVEVNEHYETYEKAFDVFFPELVDYVKDYVEQQQQKE